MNRRSLAIPLLTLLLTALPALGQVDRPIPEWLVLGTWGVVEGSERVTRPYLPGEADAAPRVGEEADGRTWMHATAETANLGRLDLLPVLAGISPVANAASYAFTWITTPEDRTVTLAFESDDDLRVWLNGTLVVDHEVARGVGSGTDTATVRLAAGANRLLLKVVNRGGGFGLSGRLLADSQDDINDLVLGVDRPADAVVASAPAPAVTLSPPAVAASAVLDAATGTLRVPLTIRAARWGGLQGDVQVGLGGHTESVPSGAEGEAAGVQLALTWTELAEAARRGDSVTALGGGRRHGRPLDAGAVLSTLAHPVAVDGWQWRDTAGSWQPLPTADAYGVDAGVRRRAAELTFRTRIPRGLGGLTLQMDAAEFGPEAAFTVDGAVRRPDATGRVTLCGPCNPGDSLAVTLRPASEAWWDPPRLLVPDAGWFEMDQGARWARFFLGDAAAVSPGRDVATELLSRSLDPDKTRYRALVTEWMQRLEPAARTITADTIDLVGNSHIDAAWLWRWPETVDVVRNTWRSATKLLAKYPEATYAASAAQYYVWLEQYEPALLEEIKELATQGRWELVGGWWVEPDVNVPSGEALVRQGLYGQRTFQRIFGNKARVAWIPDTFGYAWTLPQIFKKAGFDYFVTQKLRWNDTDKWSADRNLFWWQGRDGSRILTYVPYGYSHHLESDRLGAEWIASRDSTPGGRMMVLYGVGDHGGGPTMEMMERRRALERVPTYPHLGGDLPNVALERMRADGGGDAPVIDDELYLEYHRGVFTSQAETKAWNRRMESLLGAAEALSAHASTLPPGDEWYNYPRGALTQAWERTLFNQFHDILPGSGIGEIYLDADADYREAQRLATLALERAGEQVARTLDTRPLFDAARPWVVLNPSGRVRSGAVALPWRGGDVRVVDGDGRDLPSAVRGDTLHFRVDDVPATGGKVVFLVPATSGPGSGASPAPGTPAATSTPAVAPIVLENARLRVEVDPVTGELARVHDKIRGREVLLPAGGGNRLATMVDTPLQWDAWNIDSVDGPWFPVADTVRTTAVTTDPTGSSMTVIRADAWGHYEQRLFLPADEARLDVATVAEWRADHRLLKASFPLAVRADSVWAELPYGAMARPSVPITPKDTARFEMPTQRWIDASAGGWGVSLINDSKYGYDVRGDTLRLTLLKAASYPDPEADRGTQRFQYSLLVHDGDWRSGATEAAAEEMNQPLRAVAVSAHPGQGRARGFAQVDGVELGALKMAEDGDDLVVRLVERHGGATRATLTFPWPFEWQEADLLEEGTGPWTAAPEAAAGIGLEPWEIRTLRIRRR
ncbi:MAG TPA: glycoside hydrolase family 38 C-terminal domain-containing protein [Longimicrobiales bacterium]|nr:glycoside hydrolase family 38 C-terminal domain-containing protein [Longimicrobiales bacterium]